MRSKRKSNALPSNSLQLNNFPTAETNLRETFTFCCASVVCKVRLWGGRAAASSLFFSPWDVTHCTVNSIKAAPHSTWCNKLLWKLLTVAAGSAARPQSLICTFSVSQSACLNSYFILEADFTPKVLKWKCVVFHFHFPLLSHLPRSPPFLWILFYPPPCFLLWGMKM